MESNPVSLVTKLAAALATQFITWTKDEVAYILRVIASAAFVADDNTFAGANTFSGVNTFSTAPLLPESQTALSVDGAITPSKANKTYVITKATAAAITIADPTTTTHDGARLTVISATAAAHTLSNAAGSGFNAGGAGADIGTFGGAKGDNIVFEAYQGKWYVVSKVNVTLA